MDTLHSASTVCMDYIENIGNTEDTYSTNINNEKKYRYYISTKYFRLPKIVMDDETYFDMCCESKLLYGFFLNEITFSYVDDAGRYYLKFSIHKIREKLGFSKRKTMAALKQLEEYGLIVRKRMGWTEDSHIYVLKPTNEPSNNPPEERYFTSSSPFYEIGAYCRVPLLLFNKEMFPNIKPESIYIFVKMIDRWNFSHETDTCDDNGNYCIFYCNDQVQSDTHLSHQPASNIIKQLEKLHLISRRKRGLKKTPFVYVRSYTQAAYEINVERKANAPAKSVSDSKAIGEESPVEPTTANEVSETSGDVVDTSIRMTQTKTSIIPESRCPEFPIQDAINPFYNTTNNITISISQNNVIPVHKERRITPVKVESVKKDRQTSTTATPIKIVSINDIKNQINYANLNEEITNTNIINLVVSTMNSVMNTTKQFIKVNGSLVDTSEVIGAFEKLQEKHIKYVIACVECFAASIRNPRAYITTCLYNAVFTYDTFMEKAKGGRSRNNKFNDFDQRDYTDDEIEKMENALFFEGDVTVTPPNVPTDYKAKKKDKDYISYKSMFKLVKKSGKNPNSFNDFEQRDIDFDEMEDILFNYDCVG